MEVSGSAVDDFGAPESWELADLDESMNRLMVSCNNKKKTNKNSTAPLLSSSSSVPDFGDEPLEGGAGSAGGGGVVGERNGGVSDEAVNQVDQFLREALQNPRERLSILRMEQDIQKFIRDPTQQQLEFQQLPTSYLRLAVHRVAQHYCLQSIVLSESALPDGSGSVIVVRKTSECRFPSVRLADIPISLPQEGSNSVLKVAIKQRPQKGSQMGNNNQNSSKSNHAKSVEERKEEYNRARARIFSSTSTGTNGGRPESDPVAVVQETYQQCTLGSRRMDDKSLVEEPELNFGRLVDDSSTSSSRSGRGRTEKEPVGRYRGNSRVAIFRDREVDRKDPDYDRNYDRYAQRFDPGFGFSGGPYAVQALYSPAVNYNTEFPQLGAAHRPQLSVEHQPRPMPQHIRGTWTGGSTPAGMGYGPPEAMMGPFNPNHVGAHSTSGIYLHSSHYPCPRPGMQFVNPHEHVHQQFAQAHQQQPETSFGLARPR